MDSVEVKEVRNNCYLRQMGSLSVQRLCVPSPFHPALTETSYLLQSGGKMQPFCSASLCAWQCITTRATPLSLPCGLLLCMFLQLLPLTQGNYFSTQVYTCAQPYALLRCMPGPLEHPCLLLFGTLQAMEVYSLSYSIIITTMVPNL